MPTLCGADCFLMGPRARGELAAGSLLVIMLLCSDINSHLYNTQLNNLERARLLKSTPSITLRIILGLQEACL